MSHDELYLEHISLAIGQIEEYVGTGRAVFMGDAMRQDAVIRQLEIIGEATKKLSPETTARKPQIPWRQVAGLRDRLIHAYATVDLDRVWEVVEGDVPELKRAVRELLVEARGS